MVGPAALVIAPGGHDARRRSHVLVDRPPSRRRHDVALLRPKCHLRLRSARGGGFRLEDDTTFGLERPHDTSRRDSRLTRAVLVLALLTPGAAALAGEISPSSRFDVGPAPWAEIATSPAFGPEDAYMFSDPDLSARLEPDAEAAASLVDRERMAHRPEAPGQTEAGRVAVAFSDFVSYGPDGAAYASVVLARAGGGPVRIALGAPSAAILASADR